MKYINMTNLLLWTTHRTTPKSLKTSMMIIAIIAGSFILRQQAQAAGRAGLTHDSTGTKILSDAKILLKRLDTINATDKTDFKSKEKKQLRKEVRKIKGDLRELHGARYISASVIIIILAIPFAVYQFTE